MRIVKVTESRRALYREGIVALEAGVTYPLGPDRFSIDHGADYFAFFDRLGDVHYYAAIDPYAAGSGAVAAVGAGIVRRIPRKVWYCCDLKVAPGYRGRQIPLRMLGHAFLPNYLRCRRGYAISMNPPGGKPNRVARLLSHFKWIPITVATQIGLYSLDAEAAREALPLLRRHRGEVGFLSLAGKKDIVLESTGRPMPLLHAQFGPCAERGQPEPSAGSVHMFCAPDGDPLVEGMRALGHEPSATATVIHHGMGGFSWDFILTSDI